MILNEVPTAGVTLEVTLNLLAKVTVPEAPVVIWPNVGLELVPPSCRVTEAAALSDPDAQPMTDEELAFLFRPRSVRELRERLGLSQAAFAERFRINLRTLQDWEQARRVPDQVARAYLRVIERNPDAVIAALRD